ncbi:hypothetical protein FSARC_12561 [Fusarium sarcochroum]|uniref:Uncharacterized protein n=1 Tax=Fusarium sarcochroum TaxID=1208366 RepID=A0A8H4WWW6_9HYPO|nr:hypothetical protein FSARC_12561 [Fusarium sarcochroum]
MISLATAFARPRGILTQVWASLNLALEPSLILLLSFTALALLFLVIKLTISKLVLKGLLARTCSFRQWPSQVWNSEKQPQESVNSFLSTFPPSLRDEIIASNDPSAIEIQKVLARSKPTTSELVKSQLPSTRTQDLSVIGQYTPTGFSSQEIEALGTFPDYSVLSGVPHPKSVPQFDIKTAEFRPFRPFRWTYHQTMSLMKFEPDFWIELEKNYFDRLKQRKELWDRYGTDILNYAPGSELACRELMETVLQYLCIRYPNSFSLTNSNTVFRNNLLNESTDLATTHPLHVLFQHVPEDFAIMLRDERDGMYYLKAGFICSSIGWTFGTHFERQLRAIHTEVNDYEEKMAKSMDRIIADLGLLSSFFSKMPVNKPIQRGSWFMEDWEPLFVTPAEYKKNGGTRHQGEKVTIEQCNLRVDWQTLRRLPLSGAIVFNFKAVFTPMMELRDEPYVPSILYKQITEGKPHLTDAKVHQHIREPVLDALREWKKEQLERGQVVADWKEETLPESPYYRGWEARWRSRLGFEI